MLARSDSCCVRVRCPLSETDNAADTGALFFRDAFAPPIPCEGPCAFRNNTASNYVRIRGQMAMLHASPLHFPPFTSLRARSPACCCAEAARVVFSADSLTAPPAYPLPTHPAYPPGYPLPTGRPGRLPPRLRRPSLRLPHPPRRLRPSAPRALDRRLWHRALNVAGFTARFLGFAPGAPRGHRPRRIRAERQLIRENAAFRSRGGEGGPHGPAHVADASGAFRSGVCRAGGGCGAVPG